MRPDVVPGATFPDYELPDHTGKPRTLSELQGDDPLILTLARGHYCPKEHQQHQERGGDPVDHGAGGDGTAGRDQHLGTARAGDLDCGHGGGKDGHRALRSANPAPLQSRFLRV